MGSDSGSKPGLRLLAFHISLSANTIVQPRPAWREAKPMVGEQWGVQGWRCARLVWHREREGGFSVETKEAAVTSPYFAAYQIERRSG